MSLKDTYSELNLNFEVENAADSTVYAAGNGIRLVSLGSRAFFCGFKLTTSSSKPLKTTDHPHVRPLVYNFQTPVLRKTTFLSALNAIKKKAAGIIEQSN